MTDLPSDAIHWQCDAGPKLDAAESLELGDIDLTDISNPLAVPLVECLKANRRLLDRLSGAARLIKTMLEYIRAQHVEIGRLKTRRQV